MLMQLKATFSTSPFTPRTIPILTGTFVFWDMAVLVKKNKLKVIWGIRMNDRGEKFCWAV